MITINKVEPEWYKNFKKKNKNMQYKDMPLKEKDKLGDSLLDEQGHVCCFCGIRLQKDATMSDLICLTPKAPVRIAHIIPQSKAPLKTLDYMNMCISCDTQKSKGKTTHCDQAQNNKTIPISPLQDDCISYFTFSVDGKIMPVDDKNTDRYRKANDLINILKLNDKLLISQRKKVIEKELRFIKENSKEVGAELAKNSVIQKYKKRYSENKYLPFYFVILRFLHAI